MNELIHKYNLGEGRRDVNFKTTSPNPKNLRFQANSSYDGIFTQTVNWVSDKHVVAASKVAASFLADVRARPMRQMNDVHKREPLIKKCIALGMLPDDKYFKPPCSVGQNNNTLTDKLGLELKRQKYGKLAYELHVTLQMRMADKYT